MILGLSAFTWVHTIISIVALITGIVVVAGLFASRTLDGWTALYLASAVATSVTGFFFAADAFGASQWVGVISLVALALAILARYVFRFAGAWRWIYAVGVVLGLYFLVFVTVAQHSRKYRAACPRADTGGTSVRLCAECRTGGFVVLTIVAALKFRRGSAIGAPAGARVSSSEYWRATTRSSA